MSFNQCVFGIVAACAMLLSGPNTVAAAGVSDAVQLPDSRSASPVSSKRGISQSVARQWNEQMLEAIRADTPRPTVHARNLFHVSAAMFDAWAAYAPGTTAVFQSEDGPLAIDTQAAREQAISFAAYRVLSHRFANSPGQPQTQADFDSRMAALGFDISNTSVAGDSPAAIGNRIAATIIAVGLNDGANEPDGYADNTGYVLSTPPLIVDQSGTNGHVDLNVWQPLVVPGSVEPQAFLTPHWFNVNTFAMQRPAGSEPYADPGVPPLLGGVGDEQLKAEVLELIRSSSQLDPTDGEMINISPSVVGNNSLGAMDGAGHPINPATGQPYPDNWTLRGDWGRVLAEFWADGPDSSTPPGHWNGLANAVSDHPAQQLRIGGSGPLVDRLEWDVKLYLMLNGALHDNAVATWEVKRLYDFSRPITIIRGMGELGQSSDDTLPSWHPSGLPLEAGLVEVITANSSQPGERHEHLAAHIGEIAIQSWLGHPADPDSDIGGAGWILAIDWLPYQQFDFVTPPFPGYTSGHSGFSRAAATVLTRMTGSPYFPGGIGEFTASSGAGGFNLGFEFGPSEDIVLQWATYYDAADEAGISRIAGGIHPLLDDLPGRIIGHQTGTAAFERSLGLFGTAPAPVAVPLASPLGLLFLAFLMLAIGWRSTRTSRT